MTVLISETKGDLDCHHCKQPSNLLLDVMKESLPSVHLSKAECANIVNSFKELYQEY